MKAINDALQSARMMHGAGDTVGAAKIYEELLGREPNHPTALHELGVLMSQIGDYGRAVSLLEQAVIQRTGDPVYHVDLGEAYRNLADFQNAIGCCLTALRLRPKYPEGLITLGLSLRGIGDLQGALEQFRRAHLIQPDFSPAHTNAGLILKEIGKLDEAISHFQQAVKLTPDSHLTQTNLGLALLDYGQVAEAFPHFEEAARLRPDMAVLHHNLGNSLRALNRPSEARASYLKAIRLDPNLSLSYLHIGITLKLQNSLGDALMWHKLAIEMEPENCEFWEQLADLHQKRDEADKAVECRRRVVELSPETLTYPRINLGWALQEDGQLDEAMEQYLIANRVQPERAQSHFAMSGVFEEQGKMAEAETAVRQALRLQPRYPAAYARLATLLKSKLPDDDFEAVERLLSNSKLDSQPRARLLFAIAHVLDARREYPRAALCLHQANALTLEVRRAEGVIYHPDDHVLFVDGLIRIFDEDFFMKTNELGLETHRPVFVIGLPRSGTTLVEQILASHSQVYGAGERLFGRRSFEKVPSIVGRNDNPIECIASLDEYSLKRLAGEHLAKLNALDLGRFGRIVDKLPDNYLYIGLLAAMFPQAVFIHCRRDLRDVGVSCWISDFRSVRWANDLSHIGSRFQQYRRLMEHWSHVFPASMTHIDYEDTVSDLEGVARRLLDACRLEWDPACLDFHRTQRVVRTASLAQVRQPIYTSSVARWKNYEIELADLFAIINCGNADFE